VRGLTAIYKKSERFRKIQEYLGIFRNI
jgi:hypothetical protein